MVDYSLSSVSFVCKYQRSIWNSDNTVNILLAQLASSVKADGICCQNNYWLLFHIILYYSVNLSEKVVRSFSVPPYNFKATKWQHMIKWKETDVLEPPFIRNKTNKEWWNIVMNSLDVPHFQCHSQMVERDVREVTEAAKKDIGGTRRDCSIKQQ